MSTGGRDGCEEIGGGKSRPEGSIFRRGPEQVVDFGINSFKARWLQLAGSGRYGGKRGGSPVRRVLITLERGSIQPRGML